MGGFWYATSLKYLTPPLKEWWYFHSHPIWTPKFLVHRPSPTTLPLNPPICSSAVVCRFLYHAAYVRFHVQMCETFAGKFTHKRMENWNNSHLSSKIHKYNTEFISGLKIFYVEISKNSFLTSSEPDITIVQIKLKPVLMPMMRNCEKSGAKGSSHEREPKTRSWLNRQWGFRRHAPRDATSDEMYWFMLTANDFNF